MQIQPLYSISCYEVALPEVKGLLLGDKQIIVVVQGVRGRRDLVLDGRRRHLPGHDIPPHLHLLLYLQGTLLLSLGRWCVFLQSKLQR